MSAVRFAFAVACGLAVLGGQAFAQNQNNQKPKTSAQKPTAAQQLNKAAQGPQARDHVFDGRRAPPNAVRANPAPKPNPAGQPVYSRPGVPGYKPAQPSLHIKPVPPPVISSRNSAPVRQPQPVVRSTTTATAPVKKP